MEFVSRGIRTPDRMWKSAHAAGKDPYEYRRALLAKVPRLPGAVVEDQVDQIGRPTFTADLAPTLKGASAYPAKAAHLS